MGTPGKGARKRVHKGSQQGSPSKSPGSPFRAAKRRGDYGQYPEGNPQRAAAAYLRAGGALTQQEAADRYGVPRMTVTRLLAEVERVKLTADDLDPPPLPPAVTMNGLRLL